ncbi:hypothetical protein PTI98_009479 [Pleurotus ostreatus]|nr:hypothetical protein PTI98_009479 [Pleurotus ostreatus]
MARHAEPTYAASAPRHLQGSTPDNSTADLVTLSTPLNRAGSLRLNASPRPASQSILARSLRSSTPDASGTSHAELSHASPKPSRRSLSTDLFTSTPPPNQAALTSLDGSNHRIIETSSNALVSTSKRWGRHRAELETLLALKRADKVQEVRKRLLRRIHPMIPLVQHNALPWNDLPILCLAKAVQISGIPDCCPLPGFCSSPRGISGVPTRFLSLFLKHLPDDISQGIVLRRMSAEESDAMKAGKVPVIVCNPPHPQSRHTRAKQLFIANNRMWIDRCGEPRRPSSHADDSDFAPSDDDPHDNSTPSTSVNSNVIHGRPRRPRRPRQRPSTPTPTPSVSPSPSYSDNDDAESVSSSICNKSKGKGKARAHSRARSDEEGAHSRQQSDEEEEHRSSKRSRMKLRDRK